MKEHQTIFSVKEIKNKVKSAFVNGIPDKKSKLQIIENWQENILSGRIRNSKEQELKPIFLTQFFGDILGYDYKKANEWNLQLENKSEIDNTKADAALGFFRIKQEHNKDVRVVIEIKDAKTTLDKPQNRTDFKGSAVEQCFMYSAKSGEKCKWVVVSNFLEIRLYLAGDMTKYEYFDIMKLNDESEFMRFYYLLANGQLFYENIASSIDILLDSRIKTEKKITKEFYQDYRFLREVFFRHLQLHNPNENPLNLLQYTQTIIDRILFICVIKDYDLIPYTVLNEIEDIAAKSWEDDNLELWRQLTKFFKALDKGLPPRIHKFNGGLFKRNEVIENLKIKDIVLRRLLSFKNYDFESDLSVNILGHIFEQSITDIENLKKEILEKKDFEYNETDVDINYKNKKTDFNKRKKDGVYYTPENITEYIVQNTVGKWLFEKKQKIGINNLVDFPTTQEECAEQIKLWEDYSKELKNIKILDPACGSGAFLTKTFDFLVKEWLIVTDVLLNLRDEKNTKKEQGLFSSLPQENTQLISKIKKEIVNNNLFGVDLNYESVEITKLGLWLKSASKNDPLALLDNNIKCGNSLISNKNISDKAFSWKEEFSSIMQNGGFDVIVGNPPYIGQKGNKDIFVELKNEQWIDFYERKQDLYYYFYKLSVDLLKPDGFIGFITPQSWLTAFAAGNLREYLAKHCSLLSVLDTSKIKIFADASINSMIFTFQKNKKTEDIFIEENFVNTAEYNVYKSQIKNNELGRENWNIFKNTDYINIIQNVEVTKLGDIATISPGVQTGCDKVTKKHIETYKLSSSLLDKGIFVVNENDIDFSKLNENERNYLKPFYKNSDIERYYCNTKNKLWLINTNLITDIQAVPTIKAHLEKFRTILSNRYVNFALKQAYEENKWWYLYGYRPNTDFETTKIVFPYRSVNPQFSIIHTAYYGSIDIFYLTNLDKKYDYYFILALLNSKLISYYISNNFKKKGSVIEFYTQPMSEIPIPKIEKSAQKYLADLAKEVSDLKIELKTKTKKFRNRISQNFNILLSKTIFSDFQTIQFSELLTELKQASIQVSLKQQDELEEYFKESKEEAINLIQQINQIDFLIDKHVFEIYKVSDNQKKQIE